MPSSNASSRGGSARATPPQHAAVLLDNNSDATDVLVQDRASLRPISRGERSYVETPASDVMNVDTGATRTMGAGGIGGGGALGSSTRGGGGHAGHEGGGVGGAHKMPPLPRRAHAMIHRLVEKPLEEREQGWSDEVVGDAAATGGANGPCASPARREFVYESIQDPHLAEYWDRRRDIRRIINERKESQKRHLLALYGPKHHHGSSMSSHSLSSTSRGSTLPPLTAARGSDGDERGQSQDEQQQQRSSTAPLATMAHAAAPSGSKTSSAANSTATATAAAINIDFPVNREPFDAREFLCLKTMLVPRPNFSCKIAAANCDLAWLRDMMIKNVVDEAQIPSAADKKLKTLVTFDRDALINDATQYNDDDEPFDRNLINSPRSTIVLLRNGVEVYNLLRRPLKFFAKVGEVVGTSVLKKRAERAEAEREHLLRILREQYAAICAAHPLEKVVAELCAKSAGRSAEAQQKVRERFERDVQQIKFLEERTLRIAENMMTRREENAKRAFALEETLHRKQQEKIAATKAKAAKVQETVAAKRRVIDKITAIRHEITVEIQQDMAKRRDDTTKRVADLKEQQHQHAVERAASNDARVQRSKELLEARRAENTERLQRSESQKRQRAEEFQARRSEELDALRHRQDKRHEKQEAFRAKAGEIQATLVAAIESKLDAAAERFAEFQQRQQQEREELSKRQREREHKIQIAIAQAAALNESRAQTILKAQEDAEARLAERRQQDEAENLLAKECHTFELAHKQRVVDVRLHQQAFQKLFSVSMLQAREAEILEFEEMRDRMAHDVQKGSLNLRIRRDELKAQTVEHVVKQERDIASRTYEITNPLEKFDVPAQYKDVAPRTDVGKSSRRGRSSGSSASPSQSPSPSPAPAPIKKVDTKIDQRPPATDGKPAADKKSKKKRKEQQEVVAEKAPTAGEAHQKQKEPQPPATSAEQPQQPQPSPSQSPTQPQPTPAAGAEQPQPQPEPSAEMAAAAAADDDEAEMAAVALKIQSVFRKRQTREAKQPLPQSSDSAAASDAKRAAAAALKLQNFVRSCEAREAIRQRRRSANEKSQKLHQQQQSEPATQPEEQQPSDTAAAALRIQSLIRSRQARVDVDAKRREKAKRQRDAEKAPSAVAADDIATLRVQSLIRARQARIDVAAKRRERKGTAAAAAKGAPEMGAPEAPPSPKYDDDEFYADEQ